MGIFTREEEELLRYDADAFFYFAGTMLTLIILPWTLLLANGILHPKPPRESDYDLRGVAGPDITVRRCATSQMEDKRREALQAAMDWKSRLGGTVKLQLFVVLFLWVCLAAVVWEVSTRAPELRSFDPYVILDIPREADKASIKKAYRRKSLEHHPDKNPDNPTSAAMFQQVAKAHAALTDDAARRNYAKYGNPDGPSQMKVGIALHPVMLGKESQRLTLTLFFMMLFTPPTIVVCCYLGGFQMSTSGVCGETLRIFKACIDAEIRAVDGPGVMAAAVEARRIAIFGADMRQLGKAMAASHPKPLQEGTLVEVTSGAQLVGRRGVICKAGELVCELELLPPSDAPPPPLPGQRPPPEIQELAAACLTAAEPSVPCPFTDPPIQRNAALLWAHMRRMHQHMSPPVRAEADSLLRLAPRLGHAMASVAANGQGDRADFLEAVRGILVFRRCLVQALDPDDSPLLQLPHMTRKSFSLGPMPEMQELVAPGGAEQLLEQLGLSQDQCLDIRAFCHHAPRVVLESSVEVEDEKDLAEGDLATLTVRFTRANLAEGEAAGPVHAPLFPRPKFEEWWLLVYDERSRGLVMADVVLGNGREETCKMRFVVPRAGDFRWKVFALCDSYAGLDVECGVRFSALKRTEVNHDIFIHPEDMNIRTLFEELMEGLQPQDADSDSESEDEPSKVTPSTDPSRAASSEDRSQLPSKKDDSSDGGEEVEEGAFYRISAAGGGCPIYRESGNQEQLRIGSLPPGTVFRGLGGSGRPSGWVELAGSGAWISVPGREQRLGDDQAAEAHALDSPELLGELAEVRLGILVQTVTPMTLVKKWLRVAAREVDVEDVQRIRDIDESRARTLVEEMVRRSIGDSKFEQLLDAAMEERQRWEQRILKARGFFCTQNGMVWHVAPSGNVRGLAPDGSKIRDRVRVSEDDRILIGPFCLDESKTCSCIHWHRKDDPDKGWVWARDRTLRSRMRLGMAFGRSCS